MNYRPNHKRKGDDHAQTLQKKTHMRDALLRKLRPERKDCADGAR